MDAPEELVAAAKENSSEWQEAVFKEARRLSRLGYFILPLRRFTKILPPAGSNVGYHSAAKSETTIKKWFRPKNGKFAGWNIGIACGKDGGVFALDVDRHRKVDGTQSLCELEDQFGPLPKCPVQITQSGGKHFLFAWSAGGRSSTSDLGIGLDTRGGTADEFKSHIVVYPSVVADENGGAGFYRWDQRPPSIDLLPSIPSWILERLVKKPLPVGRGSQLVTEDDLEEAIPLDQIDRMLESIDPDRLSYDEWLRVGQSINSQHCGEEGLAVWDNWSSRGARYRIKECVQRWNGFKPSGSVRIGTLFYIAKKFGWVASEQDSFNTVSTEVLSEFNEKFSLVKVGNKVRIVEQNMEGSVNVLSHHDLRLIYQNQPIDIGTGDKIKAANPVDIWLHWTHRRTHEGMGMYPPPLKCPDRYLNLWSGFNVSPQDGDVSKFTQFVFDVVCKSDREKYKWLIDWLAHICQFPGEKVGTALVIYGSEGTGKNTLTKALSLLLRPGNYTQIINARQILSNFNSYLMNSVVCVFNEAVWSGSPKEANILKGLVTEDFLSIEMKGIDMFNARNCTRFVILTNNPWAVPAGHQSRRYFVVKISDVHKGDTAYWEELHHWIEQHPQELLNFFLSRDIQSDLREAIETDELRKQREMTAERDMKVEDQIALDLVTKGKAVIASKGNYEGKWIWPNNYLLDAIRKVDPFAKATGQFSRKIKRLFEEQGYVLREGRSKSEGRFLLLPETPKPLLECLSKKYSIFISELEEADYWAQDESYRVNYPY